MLAAALARCGLVQLPMRMVREDSKSGSLSTQRQSDVHAVWPRTRRYLA